MFRNRHRALTLIDVVAAVTVCGLVVTVLAPALKTARSQTQVATCLQNLRTLGQAANGYIVENGTFVFVFPFGYHPTPTPPDWSNFDLSTEFIWGGGLPDQRAGEWNSDWGNNPLSAHPDVYMMLESERPLNQYISPGVWWCDPERRGVSNPLRRQRPMQLPDYFKCPQDSTCSVPMAGAPDPPADGDLPENGGASWEWWGTSYVANWHWAYYYAPSSIAPLIYYNASFLSSKIDRGASECVLLMENRMNYALEFAVPRGAPQSEQLHYQGWHRQQDKHAAAFLDGSARYQIFDTNYVDGPGWSAWPNRPWTGSNWEAYQDH